MPFYLISSATYIYFIMRATNQDGSSKKFGFQKYRLEDTNAYKARQKVKRRTQKDVSATYTPL